MKIRFATLDDVPLFVQLGRRFHAMTRFRDYDYNAERAAQNLRAVIETGQNGDWLMSGAANDYKRDLERNAA